MTHKTKKCKRLILIIVFILIALIAGWVIWSNVAVQTSTFTIKSDDLPKEFDGFTIAHISDFHNAKYGKNNEKLISILKAEKPDMIAITGDFIDSYHTDIECALSFAQQALKVAPCYFVAGNHEARIGSQYDELKETLEDMGDRRPAG
jgi:predicted MPP superfamily phosphohydrolase